MRIGELSVTYTNTDSRLHFVKDGRECYSIKAKETLTYLESIINAIFNFWKEVRLDSGESYFVSIISLRKRILDPHSEKHSIQENFEAFLNSTDGRVSQAAFNRFCIIGSLDPTEIQRELGTLLREDTLNNDRLLKLLKDLKILHLNPSVEAFKLAAKKHPEALLLLVNSIEWEILQDRPSDDSHGIEERIFQEILSSYQGPLDTFLRVFDIMNKHGLFFSVDMLNTAINQKKQEIALLLVEKGGV